jgi:transcriptional regulator with XRE-family HTH domain
MSELVEKLRDEFRDKEYRHAYADECLNTMIATQIKVLREQRGMTQGQLADATGMKQPRIPLLEDANYSNWTINTLKRFAKAFDVALSVKFETFSKLVGDFEALSRQSLQRDNFADDRQFHRRRSVMVRGRHNRKLWESNSHRSKWSRSSLTTVVTAPDTTPALGRKLPVPSPEAREGAQQQQNSGNSSRGLHLLAKAGGM